MGPKKHPLLHGHLSEKMTSLNHDKYSIFSAIEQQADDLNRLGEDIYRFKESPGHESKGHSMLLKFLKRKGFSVTEHYMNIKYAFRATYGEGQPGYNEHPNVGFLCQYDCNPDLPNFSGNNLVTVVALTAALGIQPIIHRAKYPMGQITVVGCPDNGQGTGKITMLEAGGFNGIDFLITAAPTYYTNISPGFMGCRSHKITFKRPAHKPTDQPWDEANPINAVVLAYQNIASIRQQFKPDWIVKSVINSGGTNAETIPESSSMRFVLKAPKPVEIKVLGEMLHRCFEAASMASGCKFEIDSMGKEFLCGVSTKKMPEVYRTNASLMGFTFHNEMDDLMEPQDIANVSTSVPTLKVFYYSGTSAKPGSDEFVRFVGSKDCQFMSCLQGKALAMTAYDIMTYEDFMREIFEEHQENLFTLYEKVDDKEKKDGQEEELADYKQDM